MSWGWPSLHLVLNYRCATNETPVQILQQKAGTHKKSRVRVGKTVIRKTFMGNSDSFDCILPLKSTQIACLADTNTVPVIRSVAYQMLRPDVSRWEDTESLVSTLLRDLIAVDSLPA